MTEEGITLGKALFHDRRLSIYDTQSCADCHLAQHAFTDPRALSPGAEGRVGTRNAMLLLNLAWKRRFFWDGRAATLREQVLMPVQDPVEMHETLPRVAEKTGVPTDRMTRVLEQFLLTLVSDDSRLDRVMRGQASFTPAEQRGFELFHTEFDPLRGQRGADYFHCHGGPLFQNVTFANNGLDSHFKDE
jgi:cytochrome c peroxidase